MQAQLNQNIPQCLSCKQNQQNLNQNQSSSNIFANQELKNTAARYQLIDITFNVSTYLCETCFQTIYAKQQSEELINAFKELNEKFINQRNELSKLIQSNKGYIEQILERENQINLQMNELKSQVQNLNELNEIIKKQDRKIKELENKQISTADKILDSCDTDLEVKSDCKAENCKGKVEETAESRLKKNILDYFKDFNEKISIELLEQFKEFSLFNQQVKKRDESSKLDFLKSYIKQSDNQLSQQILQSFSTQLSNLVSSSIEDSLYICKQVDQIIICLRDQEQIEKVIYQETDEKLMKFMKANANVQVSL